MMTIFKQITNYLLVIFALMVVGKLAQHEDPWLWIFIYWTVLSIKNLVNWVNEMPC